MYMYMSCIWGIFWLGSNFVCTLLRVMLQKTFIAVFYLDYGTANTLFFCLGARRVPLFVVKTPINLY